MNRTIRLLRHTARLLLVLTPLTLLTGFLTAKWFVAQGWIAPATARAWHVQWLPLAFVPVVFVHSLCGILFLLQRNKRLDRPWVRGGAAALWTAVLGVFAWLYLARPPAPASAPPEPELLPEPLADVGPSDPPAHASPAPTTDAAAEPARAPDATVDAAPAAVEAVAVDAPTPSGADATADSPVNTVDAVAAPDAAAEPRDARPVRDTAADQARRAEALLQARCTSCHGLDKIRSARHDAAGWGASIDRMVGYGAVVSSGERALLIRHLAGR